MSRLAGAVVALLALLAMGRVAERMARRRGDEPEPPIGTIALLALASMGGSVAFAVIYVLGGQTQLEAVALAVALSGLGLALVIFAARGMPGELVEEPWEPPAPPPEEREALLAELDRMPRRKLIGRMLVTAAGTLGLAGLVPIASLGPAPGDRRTRTGWRAGASLVTGDGAAVRTTSIGAGEVLTVFPEGRAGNAQDQVVLIDTGRPGPQRLLAYSRVCTHAGCAVGLYQEAEQVLVCPCHQSVFDVLDGARPMQGPAGRALPGLPVEVGEDAVLRATGPLDAPPGPGWWRRA